MSAIGDFDGLASRPGSDGAIIGPQLLNMRRAIQVTEALGYSDVSAFTRFFSTMSGGLTPAEWKRSMHSRISSYSNG